MSNPRSALLYGEATLADLAKLRQRDVGKQERSQWKPKEWTNGDRDSSAPTEPKEPSQRDIALKLRREKEAKQKRDAEKKTKLQREIQGSGNIQTFFKTGKLEPQFIESKLFPSLKQSSSIRKSDTSTVEEKHEEEFVEMIKGASFEALDANDDWVLEEDLVSNAERRAFSLLSDAPNKLRFDCGDQRECRNAEHKHSSNISVLSALWHSDKASQETSSPGRPRAFVCRVPVNPFHGSTFPLAEYVTGYTKEKPNTHRSDSVTRMSTSESFESAMLRLRDLYHTQLANAYATREQRIQEILKRYEAKMTTLQFVSGDHEALLLEINGARDVELYVARNVLDRTLHILNAKLSNAVLETMYAYGNRHFMLPALVTQRALLEVIKLESGFEHDDKFFAKLFADISRGYLDNFLNEKKRLQTRLDPTAAHSDEFLRNTTYQTTSDRNAEREKRAAEEGNAFPEHRQKRNKTSEAPISLEQQQQQQQQLPPEDYDNYLLSHMDTPPSYGSSSTSFSRPTVNYEPEEEAVPVKYIGAVTMKHPCMSQFRMEDARHSCTAIAFVAAIRMLTAHLSSAENPDPIDFIMNQVKWLNVQTKGASIWRPWRNKRRLTMSKAQLDDGGWDFMFGKEAHDAASSMQGLFVQYGIGAGEEFGGLVYGRSLIGSTDVDSPEVSTPSLESAFAKVIVKATTQHNSVFSAIISVGGSSMAVAMQKGVFFLFDSHGLDVGGMSTLAQFETLADLITYIRSSFKKINSTADSNIDETIRLNINTYSLYVLYMSPPQSI